MDDFKIHHQVGELIKNLGITDVTPDVYVRYLQQGLTPYVTTRVSSRLAAEKLATQAPDAKAVLRKYEELQSKNYRELDSVVHLFEKVSSDTQVKNLLCTPTQNGYENEKADEKEKQNVVQHYQICVPPKKSVPPGLCQFPKWMRERPNLTWDFNCMPRLDNIKVGPIGVLPRETQEQLLINDMLYCMQGIDGDYITATNLADSHGSRIFRVDESADPSLLEITKKITSLFSDYSTIISFVEEKTHFEHGLVNHALCEAMRDMLKDYFLLIPQLEQQKFQNDLTMQHLWYYFQPIMSKMKAVAHIATVVNQSDCFGGAVLSILHKKATTMTGDKVHQDICFSFLQHASVPYFEILQKWIYKGIICDPYSEFSVEDNELAKKDDAPVEYSSNYWEKRYTIKKENVPVFLETSTDYILRTGKYLNVVRQCGHDIEFPNDTSLKYIIGENSYYETIKVAYQFASKKLLDLLMDENDLRGRLRSVKHYFLLDKGDFFVQFMDMAEEELIKDIDDVLPSRLEALLELALRTSAVNSDKYKDDVKIVFLPELFQSQLFTLLNISAQKDGTVTNVRLTAIEAFAFDYEVKWPLSLVINQKAIASYQILFRHLCSCKYVESLLGRVWTLYKNVKSCPQSILSIFTSAFTLCQRMLNFVQNLDYYFTLEVIERHWQTFQYNMKQVENVDEVLQCHEKFLDDCIHDCMLVFPDLLQKLSKLFGLSANFCKYMQVIHKDVLEKKPEIANNNLLATLYEDMPIEGGSANLPGKYVDFKKRISEFDTEFNALFVLLLKSIKSVSSNKSCAKILDVFYRLDFVGFYTKNQPSITGCGDCAS